MTYKISVIMPTHASSIYIEESLSSIEAQVITTPEFIFEILIGIDKCEKSLVALKKMLSKYSNVRLFYFTDTYGPYIIRNTLACLSDADILVFFDSDDIMPQGFLQSLIEAFDRFDLIRFGFKDFIEVYDLGGVIKIFNRNKISEFQKQQRLKNAVDNQVQTYFQQKLKLIQQNKYLRLQNYVQYIKRIINRKKAGIFAIKREVFLNMHGYRAWPIASDGEFILRARLYKLKETVLPRKVDFMRRIHEDNLTSHHKTAMGSQMRKEYHLKRKTSIYETIKMKTAVNYTEISIN